MDQLPLQPLATINPPAPGASVSRQKTWAGRGSRGRRPGFQICERTWSVLSWNDVGALRRAPPDSRLTRSSGLRTAGPWPP